MVRPIAIASLLLLAASNGMAQDDSLWNVWNDPSAADTARLQAIQRLSWKTVFENPDSGITLAQAQLELAVKAGDPAARYEAYTTLAVGSSMRSDPAGALAHFRKCLQAASDMGDRRREANTLSNMSNVYRGLGDLPQALEHLQRSLSIDAELGNNPGLAGTYNNIGNIHKELEDLPKALENYTRSVHLYTDVEDIRGRAQALVNLAVTRGEMGDALTAIEQLWESRDLYATMGRKLELGMVHNNLGRFLGGMGRWKEALAELDIAEGLLREVGHQRTLARTHFYRGDIFLAQGRAREAVAQCNLGMAIAVDAGLLYQQKECLGCLMKAHAQLGEFRQAFQTQERYMELADSLSNLNNSREITRMELARTFQEQQIAYSLANARDRFARELAYQESLQREEERRNLLLFSAIGVLALAGGLWSRLRYMRRSRSIIQKERDRSDRLPLNILPADVAEELKLKGSAQARTFQAATVLFTDFKGFTQVAEQLTPEELVAEIDHCFKGLDEIVQRHGVEKIKTIGDAYMAVAGVPDPEASSARSMVMAALEMQEFIQRRRTERLMEGRPAFEMRIGIHTGPVVAGIVGSRKFQYDIWGDTVNTASRMESSGAPGEVNISEATYALVKDLPGLRFTPRGRVEAKGKGFLEMFFVSRA